MTKKSVYETICTLNKKIITESKEIEDVCHDTSSYKKAEAAVEAEDTSIIITISNLKKPDKDTTSPCASVVNTIKMFEMDYKAEGRKITDIKYDEDSLEKATVNVEAKDDSIIITISELKKAD